MNMQVILIISVKYSLTNNNKIEEPLAILSLLQFPFDVDNLNENEVEDMAELFYNSSWPPESETLSQKSSRGNYRPILPFKSHLVRYVTEYPISFIKINPLQEAAL